MFKARSGVIFNGRSQLGILAALHDAGFIRRVGASEIEDDEEDDELADDGDADDEDGDEEERRAAAKKKKLDEKKSAKKTVKKTATKKSKSKSTKVPFYPAKKAAALDPSDADLIARTCGYGDHAALLRANRQAYRPFRAATPKNLDGMSDLRKAVTLLCSEDFG